MMVSGGVILKEIYFSRCPSLAPGKYLKEGSLLYTFLDSLVKIYE